MKKYAFLTHPTPAYPWGVVPLDLSGYINPSLCEPNLSQDGKLIIRWYKTKKAAEACQGSNFGARYCAIAKWYA